MNRPGCSFTVMSQELLEGIAGGQEAGRFHVHGDLRAAEGAAGEGVYQELFRVDSGAADSIAPASKLEKIEIVPAARPTCRHQCSALSEPGAVATGSQPEGLSDSSRWSERRADHRTTNENYFPPWKGW